ncbi:MAG TPA: TlpA disulfide reductase family protein, partial [Polyangiaceae bacterium]|nr:TlpA disulfide reductase family protein [Polyangiaceae bacterium]
MTRASRAAATILAVATLQAGAVLVYRRVERAREARPTAGSFRHERLVPRPAPDVQLLAANGSRGRLSDYRGRPVLLHFWATWCPPCKAELPALLALGRELDREGGARVVALATDPDWDSVGRFFGGAIPSEVVRGEADDVAKDFEVSVLPDTYL